MKIKILVPIYNDWQSASKLLDEIDNNISDLDHEISVIIVNDASTHGRQEEQKDFNNIQSIKIINMKINQGHARCIATGLKYIFEKEEFDICTIFYNQFKNVITQIPQAQQIIPLNTKSDDQNNSEDNYEFEPDEDEILSNLLPKNISTQIFKAMLENSASEQGSRMSAMDNATRNAGEMVDKLTIEYNRSRQAAITKELIEIISGAESL